MLLMPDPFDPNILDFEQEYHQHFIYGDDYGHTAARVDADDYQFFCRWRWAVKYDKHGRKAYLYRSIYTSPGRTTSAFLHVEIHKRRGIIQPPGHTITDHRNGDSLDCRKVNLSWATPSMNRRNIHGQAFMELE